MSVRAKPAGPLATKDKLLAWVEDYVDREDLDAQRTLFLTKFASFANAAMESWSKVDTLTRLARCSERMLQKMREEFVELGVLELTGRFHVLEDTNRKVPLYRWALFLADLNEADRSGAPGAPEGEARVHENAPSGAQGVHLYIEPKEPTSEREERAGAQEAGLVEEIEAAIPKRMLAVSDRHAYRAALMELAAEGVDLAVLPGCLKRWSVDPLFVGRKAPVPLEKWLSGGMWRASLPDAVVEPLQADDDALPPGILPGGEVGPWCAAMAAAQNFVGAASFGSYLGPASLGQVGDDLYLVAATGVARDWIAGRCWRVIRETWATADAARRELRLVTKSEFEALLRQTGEGSC